MIRLDQYIIDSFGKLTTTRSLAVRRRWHHFHVTRQGSLPRVYTYIGCQRSRNAKYKTGPHSLSLMQTRTCLSLPTGLRKAEAKGLFESQAQTVQ